MAGDPPNTEKEEDNEDVLLREMLGDLNNLIEIRDLILSSLHHLKSNQDSSVPQDETPPAP